MGVYLAAQVLTKLFCQSSGLHNVITKNFLPYMQVLSSTVADALTYEDRDETVETRQFIRLMDMFFDCLNVRNPIEGKLRRKGFREPYRSPHDERFSVCNCCTSVL